MTRFVVSGTDTDVGKTVFAAALTLALSGVYWKPVQCGLEEETDNETLRRLTGLTDDHFLPETYRFKVPLSPHRAAELEGAAIDPRKLQLPASDRPLIVEGAGGLMVPLTREVLYIDVFVFWRAPVIVCARTRLGTINHTLMSLEALRRRSIPVAGVAFIGAENADSERTIVDIARVRRLGRLPVLERLDRDALKHAFEQNFRLADFLA